MIVLFYAVALAGLVAGVYVEKFGAAEVLAWVIVIVGLSALMWPKHPDSSGDWVPLMVALAMVDLGIFIRTGLIGESVMRP